MNAPLQTLADRVTTLAFDQHVLHAGFLGDAPCFVLADGTIHIGRERPAIRPHADGILVVAADRTRILTGGDDGRVFESRPDGATRLLGEEKGRWIDAVACGPDDSAAWSAGRKAFVRDGKGRIKTLDLPSSSQGLAFAPKGFRLAIAHVDGASAWFPLAGAPPERYAWKGSHLDVTFSPDNRFLITSMQENQLHGWRLADKGHMRMSGYPAKTRSLSWSQDGLWLATSGAEGAIVWPFAKDGPTGKAPRECGIRPARVTRVAFHPKALVLAIGYADGWVLLVRLTDASELLVRAGGDGSPISALGWDGDGTRLAFASEAGGGGLLTLPV
ncbi:WD40 repeat domain-containing protein [Rhabdaerophilum calidifontis]|uniref:WD40 repeat domain-containing protein n=1 Tax=Rhabdaerophilum calidifontis TaxID=2604328 RepID=UPI00123B0D07|nr:WD40 repeat domain-containing protein [Rhabdaerophilum calidifontis]